MGRRADGGADLLAHSISPDANAPPHGQAGVSGCKRRGRADMDERRHEALLKEYGEVCANFRMLTDIRFRLLAFLPLAAAATAALRAEAGGVAEFTLSLFGLAVTLALATYNDRNDQLYGQLVARAAEIERALGLPDGGFANRPGVWLELRFGPLHWPINHGLAVGLVYTRPMQEC